jgi:hypothetical protein
MLRGRTLHVVIWALFFAYAALFDTVSSRFFVSFGGPSRVDRIDLDEGQISYGFDALRTQKLRGEAVYALSGWAFSNPRGASPPETVGEVVLLSEDGRALVFDAETLGRPETETTSPDSASPGFVSYIAPRSLSRGAYQIGLLLSSGDSGQTFARTRWYLLRTPNTLQLTAGRMSSLDLVGAIRLRLALARRIPPLTGVAYHVDGVYEVTRDTPGVFEISGWCFLEDRGVSLDETHREIMLVDRDGRVLLFRARTVERRDISGASSELSGFAADLLPATVKPGIYRVGIAWTTGPSAPVYFLADVYIEQSATGFEIAPPPSLDFTIGSSPTKTGGQRWAHGTLTQVESASAARLAADSP